ncbi:hypothetical protein BU15DRAFT_75375 [Melanogaster broomeanus]|nr:hypothetical protein BU15DRAFT_75375 [Melanogaster broomeanus]
MDVLAAAATVVQLLQVATQVTTALGKYVASIKGAESSRSKLVDQITLISAAAKAIESVVLNSAPLVSNPRAASLPYGMVQNQAGGKKRTRFIKRLVWPLRENRIQTAIRVIQEHMPYFNCILSIDTSNRIQEITSMITSEREHTRKNEIVAAKRKLLEWFDGLDCTVKHEFTREQRQRTTGDWLFDEDLYIEWRECSFGLLWLSGKAGAGKSVLASAVIDRLSSALADEETLAYFYCDFRTNRSTSTMEILCSLTSQLLWNSDIDWLSSFPELVMRKERGIGPPVDITTLSDLLRRAARLHQRPMIVIDALDECEDLSKLLDEIVKLDKACRLFVTSRPLHSINGVFEGLPSISLNDRVDEVLDDMYFHISTELESRDRLKILSLDLQIEIRDTLIEKADGMFRWVQCQLDRLNGCWSLGDLHEVLDTLPTTLYETYERMLREIDKKEFGGRVARRALVWLVTALHPLTLSQLAEALAINCDNAASDPTIATMHKTDLIEICGSLVSFNKQMITLSHYSVKEYLTSHIIADKTYFVDDARANFELASVSIYSIMFSLNKPNRDLPDLCVYAGYSGLHHLANCVAEDDGPLLGLLVTFQNHVSNHRRSYARKLIDQSWITMISQLALYIIIRFGHLSLLRHYLDHHSVQVTQGTNPLVYAAFYRDVPFVQVLLDQGLDVNMEATVPIFSRTTCSLPPLIAATRNDKYQEELVTLLLARGSTVPCNAIHSALRDHWTCGCKPITVQILLQHGADPILSLPGGESCLHSLLRCRFVDPKYSDNVFEIARLLVGAGCDPAALDHLGISPTHLALRLGAFQLVEWLVGNRFPLPPDAVLHAVQARTADLVSMLHLLFQNGVTVDVRDDDGCNAVHILLRWSTDVTLFNDETEEALELLIEKGCDIDCQNHEGKTPLHIAARSDTLRPVEFLLDQGAQLPDDIVNYFVTANSFYRNVYGMSLLVRLVTIHGASCQARTIRGDNALHCLLSRELSYFLPQAREPVEELLFLLEKGCDFHATGSSGVTVLGTAIENGYFSIVRILLDQFAQPHVDITLAESDFADAQGNTLLHRLCYKSYLGDFVTGTDFMNRMKLLEAAGYDLARHANTLNNQGYTPLSIVLQCRQHRPAIISYLLRSGAKFSDMNPLFLDHFEWASDLSWYNDATEAYQRTLAKPKLTFDDVDRVYCLLVDHCKLPVPAVRCIMDTAEYWAYTKALREGLTIQSILTYDSDPFAVPAVPSIVTRCWVPCRVMFSCRPQVIDDCEYAIDGWTWEVSNRPHEDVLRKIQLSIRHLGVLYAVPTDVYVENVPDERSKTVFGVWDAYTSAVQLNGRQRLAVKDLTCGDTLSLVFPPWEPINDRVELEFLQIDMYFTMTATDD